jgi:UMF1 family MFS transporter
MHENIRAIGFLVAAWMLLFSLPAFFMLYQKPDFTYRKSDIKEALKHYVHLKTYLKNRPALTRFLAISMIYTDGLNTLFATAGIFAMNTFNLSMEEMLIFAIACNVSAALGSIAFSWLTDHWGALYMIKISLISIALFGVGFVCSTSTVVFYFFALTLTLFIGPLQSATRTYLIENTDPKEANTVFSLCALSGKITAFAGPLVISFMTALTDNSRIGSGSIILFFLIALYCLEKSKSHNLSESKTSITLTE